MPLAKGTPVGEYEIVQQLGAGSMGEVFEAVHPIIGKRVAIKVMRAPASEALTEARRLLEEARVVNAIKHPDIVDIFGANVLPDGRPYLVMELLEGQSFHKHLEENAPLAVGEVVWMLDGLLEPLAAAHKAGITHRDLKPTNLFLATVNGKKHVKLLDFGVAFRTDRERFTAPEVTVGSLGFMGPEQLGGNVVPQSDLYAVGCVAWLLLTGSPVFPYRAMGELARNHLQTVPPPIRSIREDVPVALQDWIEIGRAHV
jgi:serine/threonine-protein kinase